MPTDDVRTDSPEQTGDGDGDGDETIADRRQVMDDGLRDFDEAARRSAEALAKAEAILDDEKN